MADNVKPGSNVTRGDVPVHRVPEGCNYGVEIDPDTLRATGGGWPDGVNKTPKAPRSDPDTYDYQVDRNSVGYPPATSKP